jgi:hypothetical protein
MMFFNFGRKGLFNKPRNSESEPKEKAVTVSNLVEGLRLVEVGIRLFEDINWKEERAQNLGKDS